MSTPYISDHPDSGGVDWRAITEERIRWAYPDQPRRAAANWSPITNHDLLLWRAMKPGRPPA